MSLFHELGPHAEGVAPLCTGRLPTDHGPPGHGFFAVTRELCEWEYGIVGSDGDFGLIAIILLALARQRIASPRDLCVAFRAFVGI
jgi:hypothetical protein